MHMDINLHRRFSVAPMMDCTDRFARYFYRLITKNALLYTEMVTTGALIHGDRDYLLKYNPFEHPVALQLGGSNPADLAICAGFGEAWGYDEINLNVGCPSDRVQSGRFGACLMAEPELVGECVAAMQEKVAIPVTVKTRIGIDDQDTYEELHRFVEVVSQAGCDVFIFHARKAWLQGLSPKENREVPPLRYDVVYQIKRELPHLHVGINGGIKTSSDVLEHLDYVDGVMVGREAYANPYFMAEMDSLVWQSDTKILTRHEILDRYVPFVEDELKSGVKLQQIARHLVGLFQGMPGARAWRRYISENAHKPGAGVDVLLQAAEFVAESELTKKAMSS